jgi:hypothetical protein
VSEECDVTDRLICGNDVEGVVRQRGNAGHLGQAVFTASPGIADRDPSDLSRESLRKRSIEICGRTGMREDVKRC